MTAAKPKPNAETVELARLRAVRAEVWARLGQIDRDARDATTALTAARDRVAQLERRAAGGEPVTDEERVHAETDLAEAAARQRQPWQERSAGVRAAVRDADVAIQRYIFDNFGALIGVANEEADQSAVDVDADAWRLSESIMKRARAEQAVIALISTVRTIQPGDVEHSRSEPLARELDRLAMKGGETSPRARVDPRTPDGHPPAETVEAEREPAAAA